MLLNQKPGGVSSQCKMFYSECLNYTNSTLDKSILIGRHRRIEHTKGIGRCLMFSAHLTAL